MFIRLPTPWRAFILGEVKGTYINEDCLVNGKPDIKKIRPIIFNLETQDYSAIGEVIVKVWSVGREIKALLSCWSSHWAEILEPLSPVRGERNIRRGIGYHASYRLVRRLF
jgi:hypothetical protein